MDYRRLVFDQIFYGYYKREKLSNGQTIAIYFFQEEDLNSKTFEVALAISTKKKYIKEWILEGGGILEGKQTGECGIEGLMWAKRVLSGFEEFILEKNKYSETKEINIEVMGTDSKRSRVYKKALVKNGYKYVTRGGAYCLLKKLR